MNEEQKRLRAARLEGAPWRKWGPYLSERQWGTVREDYGPNGDAWNHLSHDLARSRAYRWGEDGLAGISDDRQILCFALALWNGKDPILKERLFGLTNGEGNHGEDVKEYYFYLDSTPTHSYMRYLYKYPQRSFPYLDLVETNRRRSRSELEYELIDTGVFADDRYFDVYVEYAKAAPEDMLVEISVFNRGQDSAPLHLLPTLWFRNTWAGASHANDANDANNANDANDANNDRPVLRARPGPHPVVDARDPALGAYRLICPAGVELWFVDNETNPARSDAGWPPRPVEGRFFKDGINNALVNRRLEALNPTQTGTKAAAHLLLEVPAESHRTLRLRLTSRPEVADDAGLALGPEFAETIAVRRREADAFYADVIPPALPEDRRRVARQALAGMLWSKQFYDYDVDRWLADHRGDSPAERRIHCRNEEWHHLVSRDVISIPDKWEYPWCAAWDLAFHAVPLGLVDPDFAKQQLLLLLQERYLHPNGQVLGSEWNFGEVNPPVHAWAAYFLYQQEKQRTGEGDLSFLKAVYQKLLLNFTWWVNRKDPTGRNVFEGGFLGLDTVGLFDRTATLPAGGHLEQADGTAWMAFYAQMMLQLSLELALADASYVDMALKFFEHFVWIASAMVHVGGTGEMWDEDDGFFYDVVRAPGGGAQRLRIRSIVGLLPLCTATVLSERVMSEIPELGQRAGWFVRHRPHLLRNIHDPRQPGYRDRRLLSLLSEERLRRVLARLLDEDEFLSPFGIRSLSRAHLAHPVRFEIGGRAFEVGYQPAEATDGVCGGNSNWGGPIWLPVNGLLIRALLNYYGYYGPSFRIECPTGSGRWATLYEVAEEVSNRVVRIFTRDERGRRPVFGGAPKFGDDPLWRDHLLFYEYFHGDNGAGIGASHQTGWTGLVASFLHFFATMSSRQALDLWDGGGGPSAPGPAPPGPSPHRPEARGGR